MKDIYPYLLLLAFVIVIAIIPPPKKDKIGYCYIDSVSTIHRNEITPEFDYKYWTDCNQVFFSKNEYKIGDSIKIKLIDE